MLNDQFGGIKQHLEEYLIVEQKNMNPIDSYKILFDHLKKLQKTTFLNFNYTDTLHKYDVVHENASIIHIHGELKAIHNPIIFGFAADDTESRELIDKNDKEYMRNIKKHNYKRTSNEERLIKYLNATKDIDVLILGHSCGISDKLILNQIFNHKHIKSVRTFYYEDHEHYFETQVNIDRIMKNDTNFRKLINFSKSHRMPQANDSAKQIDNFKTYIRNLTSKQLKAQENEGYAVIAD